MRKLYNPFADAIVSFAYVILFLLWKGIVFNTADQGEHLSLVYKALDHSLYPFDFYVNAAWNHVTIRFYYVHLVSFLSGILSVEWAVHSLLILSLFASVWGWIKITRLVSADSVSGYFAPFLIFFVFYGWSIGGNAVQYNLLICSTLAKAIAPWAIYCVLRNRWTLAGILLGISGLFQILVALQWAIILGAYLLIRGQWKKMFSWAAVFLLFSSPMLLPILYRQFFVQDSANEQLFYDVLYRIRNPHHYLPSLFPLSHYVKAVSLWTIALVTGSYNLDNQYFKKLKNWILLIILGLLTYTILLEVADIQQMGKLQFFKTTIWAGAISCAILSVGVEQLLVRWLSVRLAAVSGILGVIIWVMAGHFKNDSPLCFDHRTEFQKELSEVHRWISVNTPKDALFATFASNESFICEARRSQYVAWNPIIHEPWFMNEWYHRFSELYHHPFKNNNYRATLMRADQAFHRLFRLSQPFTHALMLKSGNVKSGVIIYETEHFVVLENTFHAKKQ